MALVAPAAAQASSEPIYYQDPDGRPFYSLTPEEDAGRPGLPGRAGRRRPAASMTNLPRRLRPATTADRRIKYYRNPMGLADTSPVPKKDSMGMDYIPVYEGEDTDDGAVKLSPGKIQRTGVKSEPAALRVIRTTIRAPGTIQLDERRISVISMRSESWVQKVADVTTGVQGRQGPAADGDLQPGDFVGGRRVRRDDHVKDNRRRRGLYGRGSRQRLMNLDVPERGDRRHGKERAPFRSRSNGRRRATASFSSAMRSRACARSPATCCFGSRTRPWSGR